MSVYTPKSLQVGGSFTIEPAMTEVAGVTVMNGSPHSHAAVAVV